MNYFIHEIEKISLLDLDYCHIEKIVEGTIDYFFDSITNSIGNPKDALLELVELNNSLSDKALGYQIDNDPVDYLDFSYRKLISMFKEYKLELLELKITFDTDNINSTFLKREAELHTYRMNEEKINNIDTTKKLIILTMAIDYLTVLNELYQTENSINYVKELDSYETLKKPYLN